MIRLLGGCLQAVGILIAGLFGLCTVIMIVDANSWRSVGDAVGMAVFTILPFLVGVGLIWAGRALVRGDRGDEY